MGEETTELILTGDRAEATKNVCDCPVAYTVKRWVSVDPRSCVSEDFEMKNGNCSRRTALKTIVGGTAASLLHAQGLHRDLIRLDAEFQTIENFSASDCWSMQKVGTWSLPNRNRLADLLFSQSIGIGLSCWRFNIGGAITDKITTPWRTADTFEVAEGMYDWTRQAPEHWFLGAAKAREVPQFLAFVNSPPGRMTRTGITYGRSGPDPTNLKPGFEGQFARYLLDILEHFRNNPDIGQRIAFDYISPVNEPNVEWNGKSQEGCRAANDDVKAVLRALDAELKKRKCPTEITGIEVSGLPPLISVSDRMSKKYSVKYGDYLDDFLGDKAIAGMLNSRFSYHDYGSELLKGQLVENREAVRKKFDQYPGWKPWMSEFESIGWIAAYRFLFPCAGGQRRCSWGGTRQVAGTTPYARSTALALPIHE